MNAPETPEGWNERDEAAMRGWLRGAPGGTADPAARERVRAAVQAEWHAAYAARRGQRRRLLAAAAVSALAIGAAWWFTRSGTPDVPVARAERVLGIVTVEDARALPLAGEVASGAVISTAPQSGALLRLSPELTVRIAELTRIEVTDREHIRLESGRLFVASSPGAAAPLTIETAAGDVMHVGTQFEVVAAGSDLEVAVREGSVRVDVDAQRTQASAGEVLFLAQGKAPVRGVVAATDPRWDWIGSLPSAISIEGRSFGDFLAWYSAETGLPFEFADDALRARASAVTLHGSVDGLDPAQALAIVAASANVTTSIEGDRLRIGPPAP